MTKWTSQGFIHIFFPRLGQPEHLMPYPADLKAHDLTHQESIDQAGNSSGRLTCESQGLSRQSV